MGCFPRPNPPKKLTTKDILRLLQILFHIPSKRSMGLVERVFGICRTCSRLELYDVNFGGIERMTKRLTIALVALAIFVLVATLPVSADKTFTSDPDVYYYQVANQINAGATVFVGEQHLNLTFAAPGTSIGWWAPGTATTEPATTTLIISNPLTSKYQFRCCCRSYLIMVRSRHKWYLHPYSCITCSRSIT